MPFGISWYMAEGTCIWFRCTKHTKRWSYPSFRYNLITFIECTLYIQTDLSRKSMDAAFDGRAEDNYRSADYSKAQSHPKRLNAAAQQDQLDCTDGFEPIIEKPNLHPVCNLSFCHQLLPSSPNRWHIMLSLYTTETVCCEIENQSNSCFLQNKNVSTSFSDRVH